MARRGMMRRSGLTPRGSNRAGRAGRGVPLPSLSAHRRPRPRHRRALIHHLGACPSLSSCLGLPQAAVKLDTDFFSAGGDSLAMAEFMVSAEGRYDMEIRVEELLADPTLAGVVRLVGLRKEAR
ncbi:acyl carrier protein [Streptomyces sp. MS1.AVA.1]|uniref:Acyl carrier protein n=1 Tax=Streptomyces machairae TaxID=3134109 RepID=A0ABU8UXF5_9ACTN